MPSSLASSQSTASNQSDRNSQNSLSTKSDQLVVNDTGFSLSAVQHLDRHGKVITDPDRSNPTRPRLERPLETIRGFEAAIEARRGQSFLR